ncbi:MAG TPA: hypothetical protein VGI66_00920 [Streptosporangiaceae bacterium]|jgi:hypothetical protein
MTRYVVTKPVAVAGSGYTQPPRNHKIGDVVELNTAEVTAIGAGNLRAVTVANPYAQTRDQLGEAFAVSNSTQ